MAEAKKDIEVVTKTNVTYALTLSTAEAVAVASVLGRVGGSAETSARKDTTAVLRALENAGVMWYRTATSKTLEGHLRFDTRG
jgi:hypothetical protein